jgi:hypothetical protein
MAREKLGLDAGEAGRLLDRSRQELDQALREIRELARGIHPMVLSIGGLGAAVEALAHRAPLPVEVGELPAQELPEQVELAAYFVVSEALTKVAKYASATQASVTMTKSNGRLAVEITGARICHGLFRSGAICPRGRDVRRVSRHYDPMSGRRGCRWRLSVRESVQVPDRRGLVAFGSHALRALHAPIR